MSENRATKPSGAWGPVYWNVGFYRATMGILRGRSRGHMYRLLAKEIGSLSTLDLCCGDGELQRWIPGNNYVGIDKNEQFVESLQRRKVRAMIGDIEHISWPETDCIVIIDSLYHFLPSIDHFMNNLVRHPFRKCIISESIKNWALSPKSWLVRGVVWATRVDGQAFPGRFTESTLSGLFKQYGFRRTFQTGYNLVGTLERT
jgi:trans-aconitate methyltransferase